MLIDIGLLMLALSTFFGIIVYLLDRYEKEPLPFLIFAFMAGMTVAAIIPCIHSEILSPGINDFLKSSAFTKAFLSAGFIEEFFKFIAFFLILKRGKSFNEPMDGIIYLAFVGAGFAYLENIAYTYKYVSPLTKIAGTYGKSLLFMTFARSIPGHILFAILPGFIVGRGLLYGKRKELDVLSAFFLAVVFHGIYDYFLFVREIYFFWIFVGVLFLISSISVYFAWKESPFKLGLSPYMGEKSFTEEIYLTESPEKEGSILSILLIFIPIVLSYGILLFIFMTLLAL